MKRDTALQTLEAMRDAVGHFWLGSTSEGRSRIDRALTLAEILELAIEGAKSAQPPASTRKERGEHG